LDASVFGFGGEFALSCADADCSDRYLFLDRTALTNARAVGNSWPSLLAAAKLAPELLRILIW